MVSSAFFRPGHTVGVPGYHAPAVAAPASWWVRADALWYLRIAKKGYGASPGTLAFFPLYPMVVRCAAWVLGGREVYAALAVSALATLAGFVLLHLFMDSLAGARAARAAVLGLAVFPASFFLLAPYAESLLVALGAAGLLLARRGRPAAAGVAGALAALTRPFGVLLAVPLLVLAGSPGRGLRRWLAPAGPVAGALVWAGFGWVHTGRWAAAVSVQSLWQRRTRFPLATLASGLAAAWRWSGNPYAPYFLLDALAAVAAIAMIILLFVTLRRRGVGLALALAVPGYGALALAAVLSTPFPPRPLMSVPRFVLGMFPITGGLGLLPAPGRVVLAVASAGGLVLTGAAFIAARPIF